MEFTGERLILGTAGYELEAEHILRYEFAKQFVSNKRVLDAACGAGYGSAILAKMASSVWGIDISQEAVTFAEATYAGSGVHFVCGSVTELPFEDNAFDVVVSYETLEHIDAQSQELFLAEIKRVLTPDGVLIMSTPNREVYDKRGCNKFHICERSFAEFGEMLSERYANVCVFSQQWETGISVTCYGESEAVLRSTLRPENAEYLVAVCSDSVVKSGRPLIAFAEQGKYQKVLEWAIENDSRIEDCNAHIKSLDDEIEKYRAVINRERVEYGVQVDVLRKDRELFEREAVKLKEIAAEKTSTINALQRKEVGLKERIAELERELSGEKVHNDRLSEQNTALQRKEGELNARVTELNEKSAELGVELLNKSGHIELLLESERELERIKDSRSWRFMCYVWRLRDLLIPKGSRRRLFGKMLVKFIKHPIRFLSKCTPKRIGRFFTVLRQGGAKAVAQKLDDCLMGTAHIEVHPLCIETAATVERQTVEDYAHLCVPNSENPLVSIVIPVYNQFAYTHACVSSILNNSGEIPYEIIVADDCSTDLTEKIDQIVTGLHTIHNKENLRFLLNCNNAAKQARGKYILFLNNDTQVQADWLAPLVTLMEKDDSIGMTGSKLVYPDGRLQEAGGILWKDGSAWNYGNRADSNAPEYNYVKEVDYISGASICVRKALWEEIGGFDEQFAPAYCEDSDLAFEVRRRGYKVLYQPLSVVVHFEGVSNGTDTSSGQKAYQVVNQEKFYEKWKDVLTKEHFPNGENAFQARDRSYGKKTVLMIDHYVPQYDKDAGSRTVFQYINLFVALGFNVKFIGDNFYQHEPYTKTLQQMGVEVLYGADMAKNWEKWIKENAERIDYAFLNRPHIAIKYIDFLRKHTNARVVYYGHDLAFLRGMREYEVTGNNDFLRDAQEWKEKELTLMQKADMSYYPSCVEVEEIHRIAPEVRVKAIPAYLFGNVEWAGYDFEKRNGLMFIGGFGHRPNVDAVKWLAQEVMPRLEKSNPSIVIYILGSNPPKDVLELQSNSLRIIGFVSDEELLHYYSKCRMVIVPLRYGAGIKGKVVEAMRYGVPVLTTSVGAEGITGAENILAMADSAEEFAKKIATLYGCKDVLVDMSEKEVVYVQKYFSPNNAVQAIKEEFGLEDDRQ